MASKEIVLKLIVDSKTATIETKKVKQSIDEVAKAEEKLNFLRSEKAIELEKINQLQRVQKDINTGLAKSELGLASATGKSSAAFKATRAQAGLNNAILLETGRLASDASYGFTAIANNLSQVVSLFTSFSATAGGFTNSMKQLLKSLWGTGGLLIGIQLLISFLPALIKRFKAWREGTDDLTDAQKELTKTLDDLIKKGEENNESLLEQEELLKNAGDELLRLGRLYKEESNNKSKSRDKQGEYNKQIEKSIEVFEKYGIEVDRTRLKEEEYIKDLVGRGQTVEKLANEIFGLQKELEVGRILGAFDEVEEAERELEIYKKSQELFGNKVEQYTQSMEYAKLVARVEAAKNKAQIKAQEEGDNEESFKVFKKGLLDLSSMEENFRKKSLQSKRYNAETQLKIEIESAERVLDARRDSFIKRQEQRLEEFKQSGATDAEILAAEKAFNASKEQAEAEHADVMIQLTAYQQKRMRDIEFENGVKRIRYQEQLNLQEVELIREKIRINEVYLGYVTQTADVLRNAFKQTKAIATAALILEKGAAIASVVVRASSSIAEQRASTDAANAKALATLGPFATGQIVFNEASFLKGVKLTKLSAGFAIGSIVAQTISSFRGMKGGGDSAGGGGAQIQAPDFNIVGASNQSLLAQTVAGAESRPVKAFVVGKDISTQQELDRNITNTASFG
jgi:hypothetical protein